MPASMTLLLLAFLSLFTLTLSLPLRRDVFVPPITYPNYDTVWIVGQHHNITWNINDAPVNITNKIGKVYLANNTLLDLERPLATDFSILDGRVRIEVPNVPSGHNYALVLMGDSGNYSPTFTIKAK